VSLPPVAVTVNPNEAYMVLRNDKAYYGERAAVMLAKLTRERGCQLRLLL
jgi:hypothetical protein